MTILFDLLFFFFSTVILQVLNLALTTAVDTSGLDDLLASLVPDAMVATGM